MRVVKKILCQTSEKIPSLSSSLCSYFDSLNEASLVTKVPNSKIVVLHLPKEVTDLVIITQKDLNAFLNNITGLINKMNDLILSL